MLDIKTINGFDIVFIHCQKMTDGIFEIEMYLFDRHKIQEDHNTLPDDHIYDIRGMKGQFLI